MHVCAHMHTQSKNKFNISVPLPLMSPICLPYLHTYSTHCYLRCPKTTPYMSESTQIPPLNVLGTGIENRYGLEKGR